LNFFFGEDSRALLNHNYTGLMIDYKEMINAEMPNN